MSENKNNMKFSAEEPENKNKLSPNKKGFFGKLGGKAMKAVPFLGNAISFGGMAKNLFTGNFKEAGSDAISMLPGIGNLWTAYTVASDIKDNINTNTTNTEQQKPSSKATENINKTNNTHNTINENNPKESKKSGFFKNLLKYGLPAYAATEIISSLFSSDEDVKSNDYKTDYNVEGKKLSNDFELNKTKEEIKAQSNKNNSSDLSETLSKTLDKDKEINDKKFEAFRNDLKEIKELLGQLINVSGAHAEISNVSAKASQIIAGNSMVKDYYEHNSNYSFEFQN